MLKKNWLYLLILVLILPALLINLGLLTFIDDEAIRALVALEMEWSNNYITPTLHGFYYYNKPPLWNWILLVSFWAFGEATEFSARFPTVICLLAYCATIYYYSRKHFNKKLSFFNALMFLTCGRILLWDSMLALIDICFSWAMFTLFMVIYHRFKKKDWLALFVLSYLLMAVGFMLKGLPAIVFQGFTLLAWFLYKKSFWKLFSWQHVVGGLTAIVVVGAYYLAYHQYNSLYDVFPTLLSESSKRTVVQYGIGETLKHILVFPFEMVYHFLPWSLFILFFLRKSVWAKIRANEFISYCLLIFLVNIVLYWTSPEVYPRYLLMHAPLLFTVYIYLWDWHRKDKTWALRGIEIFLGIVAFVLLVASWYPVIQPLETPVPAVFVKCLILFSLLAVLCWWYWRRPKQRMLTVVAVMLVFRLSFNWFVIPDRNADEVVRMIKDMPIEMGERWKGKPLKVYEYTLVEPTNSFYLERSFDGIIPRQQRDFRTDEYYIVNLEQYPLPEYNLVDSFYARHERHMYYLVTLPEASDKPVEMIPIHEY